MRTLVLALAATSLTAAVPALAASPFASPPGKDPKVCLLTFSSASMRGADAAVTKAQYVPLQIAVKLQKDEATQGIAYYGIGTLTASQQAQVDYYYPNGSFSEILGVPDGSDTETLCNAFAEQTPGLDEDSENDD